MTGKEKIHAAIKGSSLASIPCAPMLIRFAAVYNRVNLRDYFLDADIFAESHLRLAEEFDLDAVMMASEPTRIVKTFGGDVEYLDNNIPHVCSPLIREAHDIDKLYIPDFSDYSNRMGNLVDASARIVKGNKGRLSVVGWADAPFAEACNMMTVENMLMLLYDNPSFAHRLLEFNTKLIIAFLEAQLEVGCDVIAIGDAAASLLNPEMYAEFAFPYEVEIIKHFHTKKIPLKLHMCGNNTDKLEKIVQTGIDILNVDQQTDIRKARSLAPNLCLKGNLDPVSVMKNSTPESVYNACSYLINTIGPKSYIVSGGCELPPDMPPENLRSLVRCASERGIR